MTSHAAVILRYGMEEASGNLVDQIGIRAAAVSGSGHAYQATGPNGFGKAVALTGNGSWQLSVGDSAILRNLSNNFTVAAWIYRESATIAGKTGVNSVHSRIIGDDAAWDADGWALGVFSDGRVLFTKNGIVDAAMGVAGTVPANTWVHLAATVSSTAGITLYVNGVSLGTNANTANINTGLGNNGVADPYGIGRGYGPLEAQWFAGRMDDVQVHDQVLSAAQVQALMLPPRDPALVTALAFQTTGDGTPQMLQIPFSNAGANQNLAINGVTFAGANAGTFSVPSLPADLAPGANGTVPVNFVPDGGFHPYTATMTISSNDPERPMFDVAVTVDVLDPSIDSHLVSHFTFDDPGQLGHDDGTFANHGVAGGNAAFSSDSRLGSGALVLDGNGDYLDCGGAAEYSSLADDGNGFTLTAWIKPDGLAGVRRIFSTGKFTGFSGNGWGAGFSGSAPFATTYGRFDFNSDVDSFSTGLWTHVAYVYRPAAGQILFYVDGSLVATINGTAGMVNTADNFIIGGIAIPGNGQWFSGALDDLRVYDIELDAVAVAALASMTSGPVITYFYANPAPLPAAGVSTLTWNAINADRVTLGGGSFADLDVTGQSSISTGNLTATTPFTLTASVDGVETSQQVTVAVTDSVLDPVINEFLAANASTLADEDGDYSDWIEIHNPNAFDLSLAGWHLTDSVGNPGKWTFPAVSIPGGGYLLVFATDKRREVPGSQLHSNFKLSAAGEYLALTRPDLSVAHAFSPAFPPQIDDFSYGAFGEGGAFFLPTPGTVNGPPLNDLPPTITAVTSDLPQPGPDDDLPIFATVLPTGGALGAVTLHYRVDFGAESTLPMTAGAGDQFAASIPASAFGAGDMVRWYVTAASSGGSTTRAPAFLDPLGSAQYFGTVVTDISVTTTLPVLYWFAENEAATETRTGTQASVFFDGKFYDNIFCRIRGQSAGSWPKHKFKFDFFKGEHFRWDPAKPKVEEFNLQSSYREVFGQSGNTSYMRETMMFQWMNEVGAEAPKTFHLQLRRNGSFYGLYAFVEQVDGDFLTARGYSGNGPMYKAAWQGGGPATLSPNPVSGQYRKVLQETEPFTDLTAFCAGINVANPDRFSYVWDHVDVAQWINVIAAMNVPFNHDQLTKNYYVYREPETGNWHRFPWDADQSFPVGQYITGENWTNPLYGDTQHTQELNGGAPNPAWQNHMHDAIMDNPVTRAMYLRRVKSLADHYLSPTGSIIPPASLPYFENLIESTRVRIKPDADADRAAWAAKGVTLSAIESGINELLNTALPARRTHLFQTYALGGATPLLPAAQPENPTLGFGVIDYNPASGNQDEEYIEVRNQESVAIDISKWTLEGGVTHAFQPGTVLPANGSLFLSPSLPAFRARATSPKAGENRFAQGNYRGHLSNLGETLTIRDTSGAVVVSTTTPYDPSDAQRYLVVSEIMYHPVNDDDEFIELLNTSDAVALDLGGIAFTAGINYTFPAATMLAPGGRVVVTFADFGNATRLNNGGDTLKLEDADGSTIREFRYDDEAPWPTTPDGGGPSLVLVNPESVPDHGNAANWRPSTTYGGNPGADDRTPLVGDDLITYTLASAPSLIVNGAGLPEFAYAVNLGADAVASEVQTSTDFITWGAANATLTSSIHNGDGVLTRVLAITSAPGGTQVYVRIRLTTR